MRLSTVHIIPFLSLSAVPFARANNHPHHYRQVASSGSAATSAAPTAATGASGATAAGTTVTSGTSVASGASAASSVANVSGTLFPTPSFSLASQNPTAVPISSIIASAPSAATSLMPTPLPAGTKPSNIPNAPGLPSREHFTPSTEGITQ